MPSAPPDFDEIWSRWVMPLAGQTVSGLNGLTNQIVAVDWTGVVRVSRNELRSRIPIEPFQWVVARVLGHGSVERRAIHKQFPHRFSSGIQLILEQVPIFEAIGRPAEIRLRDGWREQLK
jgi:restriction system protein